MTLTTLELGLGIPTALLAFFAALIVIIQMTEYNSRRVERHQLYVKRYPTIAILWNVINIIYGVINQGVDGPWFKETKKTNEPLAFFLGLVNSLPAYGMI